MAATLTPPSSRIPVSDNAEAGKTKPGNAPAQHPQEDEEFEHQLTNDGVKTSSPAPSLKESDIQNVDWDAELEQLNKTAGQGHPAPHDFPISDELNAEKIPQKSKPSTKERIKLFVKDLAYPTNHAFVCTINDYFLAIPIGILGSSVLRRGRSDEKDGRSTWQFAKDQFKSEVQERKEAWNERGAVSLLDEFSLKKGDDVPPKLAEHNKKRIAQGKKPYRSYSPGASWAIGEFAGDFGAIPVVVGMKHFLPSVMNVVEKMCAPVARPFFTRSARRNITARFNALGLDTDSPQYKQAVDDIVNKEIKDLPMAVAWTFMSPILNILLQKTVLHNKDDRVMDMAITKTIGSVITSVATVGIRTVSPHGAQKWDTKLSLKANSVVSAALGFLPGMDRKELKAEGAKAIHDEHAIMGDEEFLARYGNGKNNETRKAASHTERENNRPPAEAMRGA